MDERRGLAQWGKLLLLFGLYLTCHGYHSRDGDQAYRLPLLIDRQDPEIYRDDPFVRAFDAFNPHRGYLALLDLTSRPFGLSAALFGLYAATFGLTCLGIDRLARLAWPDRPLVGFLAIDLVLIAKAGNIGTNHLFEPLLLDRLIGFALGWLALGDLVGGRAPLRVALLLGLAAWVHPSLGLQLGMLVGTSWVVLAIAPGTVRIPWRSSLVGLVGLAVAFLPALVLQAGQSGRFFAGLPVDEFVRIEASVQSPQHMMPHLWRGPQWIAFGCYLALALFSLLDRPWSAERKRLATVFGINLLGLVVAYAAVEGLGDPRAILFQPFRMATCARGLALILAAGRLATHWDRGSLFGRCRVILVATGFLGDRALLVATVVEATATLAEARPRFRRWAAWSWAIALGFGLDYLAKHDPQRANQPILVALVATILITLIGRLLARRWERPTGWTPRRYRWAFVACWALPIAALLAPWLPISAEAKRSLAARCRFVEVPEDDVERLALWCRSETPANARFVGPPQPKTFRFWSRRSLAFNRSGSPYHAAGIADWAERFRRHVGFDGTNDEFASAFLRDRQDLERGFDRMTAAELIDLVESQDADHLLARPGLEAESDGRLECIKVDGRYAVYRVRPPKMVQAQRSAGTG